MVHIPTNMNHTRQDGESTAMDGFESYFSCTPAVVAKWVNCCTTWNTRKDPPLVSPTSNNKRNSNCVINHSPARLSVSSRYPLTTYVKYPHRLDETCTNRSLHLNETCTNLYYCSKLCTSRISLKRGTPRSTCTPFTTYQWGWTHIHMALAVLLPIPFR
jgi:hypothetical protein